jgi:glutathione S-transferase
VTATLYAIPASNAVMTAQLALERKGIPFRRVDQIPALHRATMRARGFPGSTVPGLTIDGRRIHGSVAILEALDELQPEPPLYPREPADRAAVEEAVAWGEDVYQRALRFLLPYSMLRRPGAVASVLEDSLMVVPTAIAARTAAPLVLVNSLINRSDAANVRRTLAEMPAMLDRVDQLIERGVLDAGQPRAADFMIAPTSRAWMWWDDLRPAVEGRPLAEHARRIVPRFPGSVPPVFPAEALSPLRP